MYDFSSGFGVINNAFANIGKQNELAFKQRALAELGKDISAGNYASAAQKAIASGDASLGVSLLGLGQKAQEKAAEAEWLRRNGGIADVGAAAPAGGAPLARLGQGVTPTRGVQVANSEEDVQRLEAEASGLTQAGQRSEPRGLRNNNPGNIEGGRFAATVQGFQGSDGRFAQYATPEQGIQAADKLLTSYAGRGLNTVAGIVNRWAPPTENNTGAYVAQVAKELGVDPNQPLDMARPEVRQRLIAAKIRVENGKQPYAEDVFQRALNPNWQSEVASFEGGGARPVQVAQAPAQPGQPVADAPAPGAAQAQGFVIPGTSPQQTAAITADPQVQNLLRALDGAPERFKPGIQKRLDLRIEELKQARGEETRALDAELRREQLAKARRENAATAAPTTKVVKQADGSEVAVQWDSDNRRWVPLAAPEGGNAVRPAGTKLTEGQSKDLVYHTRGLQALEAFEPVANAYADGLSRVAAQVPGGNYAVSEQFQMARQSGRNFLASVLRKDTGAAVTESEERLYGEVFLPSPGDKPGTLAQKAEARKQAIDAIRGGLGTAEVLAIGQRLVNRGPGEAAPARAAPQPAPAAPPPQRPAAGTPRTATNPNTGERIMLTPDGQWVPYS